GVAPHGGRVTAAAEVDEARQFLEQARLDAVGLPAQVRAVADTELALLRAMVVRTAPPDSVAARANALVGRIAAATGGALDPFPARPPSLARGAAVYRDQCLACHGQAGRGDGPKAKQLEGPPPANLADRHLMRGVSPVDVYRKITIGVAGTAMPQFEETLSPEDRWAVAIFATVQSQVDSAVALRSSQLAFDAYITFEQVETEVRARNSALASDLEDAFAALRARAAGGAGHEELDAIHARLLSGLERAERLVADRGSAANLFMESFVLLLREGV